MDISKAVKEAVAEYVRTINDDTRIQGILEKVDAGNGTYRDALKAAGYAGRTAGKTVTGIVSQLPVIEEATARQALTPVLKQNYEFVSGTTKKVQTSLNKQANLGIKAIVPKFDAERVEGLVTELADSEIDATFLTLLEDQIANLSAHYVDESVRENADFQYDVGLKPKVIRISTGKCCEWCANLTGEYRYPDVPEDVYRRHTHCDCIVEYLPGDARRAQDVWSKKWRDPTAIEERKALGPNLYKRTPEEILAQT